MIQVKICTTVELEEFDSKTLEWKRLKDMLGHLTIITDYLLAEEDNKDIIIAHFEKVGYLFYKEMKKRGWMKLAKKEIEETQQ